MKVILWMLASTLFIWATLGLKDSIDKEELKKQNTIDSLQSHIDSLIHEIDNGKTKFGILIYLIIQLIYFQP